MTNKLIRKQIDTKSKQDEGVTSLNGWYHVDPREYNNVLSRVNTSTPVNIDLPKVLVTAAAPKNYRSAFYPEDIGTFTDIAMGPFNMFLPNIFKGTQAIINKDYKTVGNETLKALPMNNVIGRTAGLAVGAYQLGNKEGIPKTYNFLKNGQYERAALSSLGDVFNAAMAEIGAKGIYDDLSKYKSSLNIQTHAKGGLLRQSKFNKNIKFKQFILNPLIYKFESKYLNIEPKK